MLSPHAHGIVGAGAMFALLAALLAAVAFTTSTLDNTPPVPPRTVGGGGGGSSGRCRPHVDFVLHGGTSAITGGGGRTLGLIAPLPSKVTVTCKGGGGGSGRLETRKRSARRQARSASARGPISVWLTLALVAGVLIAAAGLYMRSRSPRSAEPAEEGDQTLRAAVESSLATLESERDPRRAVILAYRHMERALAVHGVARLSAETPLEYAGRAASLLPGDGAGAVLELTNLYQLARFSSHAIGEELRARATLAFERLRASLRAERQRHPEPTNREALTR